MMAQTVEGLSHAYDRDMSPEEHIFRLFQCGENKANVTKFLKVGIGSQLAITGYCNLDQSVITL